MKILWIVSTLLLLFVTGCGETAIDKRIADINNQTKHSTEKSTQKAGSFDVSLQDIEKKFDPKLLQAEEGTFSEFVGLVLFEFYNRRLSPDDYLQFINHYGSGEIVEREDKELLLVLQAVHKLLDERQINGISYKNLQLAYTEESMIEVKFYRSFELKGKVYHFYQTTIKKVGDKWFFIQDKPVEDPEIIEMLNIETLSEIETVK